MLTLEQRVETKGKGEQKRRLYRRWTEEQKRRIAAETYKPGTSVSLVARRYDVNANLVFKWRKQYAPGCVPAGVPSVGFIPIGVVEGASVPARKPISGPITIEMDAGIRVQVDQNIDADALGRVLAVIKRLP
jgi:transposase